MARPPRTEGNGDGRLDKAARAVLAVLAQHPEGCAAGKLTLLAGYRWCGGFRNTLSALRTQGLINGPNTGIMRITDAGQRQIAGQYEPLPEGPALRDYWKRHPSIDKAGREVLDALAAHPDGLTSDQLCERTGYNWSGGFRNSLSALRTAGLIVGRNTETMRLAEELLG